MADLGSKLNLLYTTAAPMLGVKARWLSVAGTGPRGAPVYLVESPPGAARHV